MGGVWAASGGRAQTRTELVKVDGEQQPANFIVGYEDGEGPHCLTLDKYGQGLLCEGERWVLLEPEQADDNE